MVITLLLCGGRIVRSSSQNTQPHASKAAAKQAISESAKAESTEVGDLVSEEMRRMKGWISEGRKYSDEVAPVTGDPRRGREAPDDVGGV